LTQKTVGDPHSGFKISSTVVVQIFLYIDVLRVKTI